MANLTGIDNSPNTEQIFQNECNYKIELLNYNDRAYVIGESFFTSLNIYESLFEDNVINGDITILDSAGFEERLPIIGQEKIRIEFYNKRIPEISYNGTFIVYKMSEKINVDRKQMYTLFFISEEYIINLKKKVSKSYKGYTASEMVSKIYDEYISKNVKYDNHKVLHYDKPGDSDNAFLTNHIVFPRVRPFQAINMISRRSAGSSVVSEDLVLKFKNFGSFVFFENRSGFWFKSISDLLNPLNLKKSAEYINSVDEIYEEKGSDAQLISSQLRESKEKISVNNPAVSVSSFVPMSTYVIIPQNNYGYTLTSGEITVQSYRFISTFDVISNIVGGMYGSTLLTYDPITQIVGENVNRIKRPTLSNFSKGRTDNSKRLYNFSGGIDDYQYNYLRDFYDFRHVSENNPEKINYPLMTKNHIGIGSEESFFKYRITNFGHKQRRHLNLLESVMTGNTKRFATFDTQVERYVLTSPAQKRMLKNIVVQIKVGGDQTRKVGEVVELKIPSSYYTIDGVSEPHTFYRGNYLITKIRHKISQNSTFITEMELVKDSLFTKLPVQDDVDESGVDDTTGQLIISSDGRLGGGV